MEDWFLRQRIAAAGTIVLGVHSCPYYGLVVSRASRFNASIREAERPLKGIEGIQEDKFVWILDATADLTGMAMAADDLAADGHWLPASLCERPSEMLIQPSKKVGGRSSWETLEKAPAEVRRDIGSLRPIWNPCAI